MTIVYGVIILFICIVAHEFGHLLVGLWNGAPLSSINIGSGPVVWEKLFDGIWLRIRLLPLGGNVIICWPSQKRWKNIALAAGGPAASAIGAVVCFAAGWNITGDVFAIDVFFNLRPAVISGQPTDGELILRQLRRRPA